MFHPSYMVTIIITQSKKKGKQIKPTHFLAKTQDDPAVDFTIYMYSIKERTLNPIS